MSGGSWDYVCFKVSEASDNLKQEKSPLRRAFGDHLSRVAHALHEIEWVDSGDKSSPADIDAIKKVFEGLSEELEMKVLLDDARSLIEELKRLGAD